MDPEIYHALTFVDVERSRGREHHRLRESAFPCLVLWCFVLNPHRRSPYPESHLELRDKLRVSYWSYWSFFGALVLCIKPTLSFPVPQIPS